MRFFWNLQQKCVGFQASEYFVNRPEPTKAVGMTGELTKGKFKSCAEKNKPFGEGESPCKHRANVHLRRLQGRKPLTPMPPSGGRLRGHDPQKGNGVSTDTQRIFTPTYDSSISHSEPSRSLSSSHKSAPLTSRMRIIMIAKANRIFFRLVFHVSADSFSV